MAGLCAALLCYVVGGAWAGLQSEVFLARQVERADWEAARLDTRQVDTEVECGGACLSSRQCVGFSVQATESNRKFYQPIDNRLSNISIQIFYKDLVILFWPRVEGVS